MSKRDRIMRKKLLFSGWFLMAAVILKGQILPYYPDNVDVNVHCAFLAKATNWTIAASASSISTAHAYAQPLCGDLDNNGKNEIICVGNTGSYTHSTSLVIYDENLQVKKTHTTPNMYVYGGYPLAIADVDRDGLAEIFIHATDGKIYCYNYDGNTVSLKWTSSESTSILTRSASLIIGDINGDGIPEILALDKIFNAQTGVVMVTLPQIVGQHNPYNGYSAMPVFADMDNDGILEVVGGNNVLKILITNPNGTAGNTATLWKTITGTGIADGATSVGDIDLDGYLDVVVVAANGCYIWKPYFGTSSTPTLIDRMTYSGTGSRALVGDINNDGYPEVAWTYAYYVLAYKYNPATKKMELMWRHSTSDASGATTMSLFDFNQDGSAEIVYRDESLLRIMNGVTGLNISTFPCTSGTAVEYPIIVDLKRNGSAQIVVSEGAVMRSFSSGSGSTWAPARYVWNQHAYNVVNINNDLTIPAVNFNLATVFVDIDSTVRRPFNGFLQQTTTLDKYGKPFYPTADIAIDTSENSNLNINVITTCDSIYFKLNLTNQGNKPLLAPYYITVYKDSSLGAILSVQTIYDELSVNACYHYEFALSAPDLRTLEPVQNYILSINDNGSGIAQEGKQQEECNTRNNLFSIPYVSTNVPVTLLTDAVCQGGVYTENGFNITANQTLNSGVFLFEIIKQSYLGCDSVVNLELTVNSTYQLNDTVIICQEELPYLYNNNLLTTAGNHRIALKTKAGCDSIINLTLITKPVLTSVDTRLVCEKDLPFSYADRLIESAGNYLFTFKAQTTACDSIVELRLILLPASTATINRIACDSYDWEGNTYFESGTYTDVITNYLGCDSTRILHLTLGTTSTLTFDTVLYNRNYHANGFNESKSGTYYQNLKTKEGCDSTVILNLTIIETDIRIPNVITPGGNSGNDVFAIEGLNLDLENRLLIYDRWGRLVFERKNYPCYYEQGRTYHTEDGFDAAGLADGVYYYVFYYKDQIYKSSLTVIRNR